MDMSYRIKIGMPNCTDLPLELQEFNGFETASDSLLARVDIVAAINYYGITELLDTIGEESLMAHLESLKSDANIRSKTISSK